MGLVFDNAVRTYVRPYLSGRLFHNGLIMFAYPLGPPVFGWYGIFLGSLVMVVVVQFADLVFPQMVGVDQDRQRATPVSAVDDTPADGSETPVETGNDPTKASEERPT